MAAEDDGKSGFPWACKTGDLVGVQEAVNAGADVNMVSTDVNKRTPLHWAADFGQLEVAQYLVAQGAKPDAPDNFGITPLLAAVYASHDNVVQYLASLGVDLSVKGPDGMTPLEAAEKASTKEILKAAGATAGASFSAAPEKPMATSAPTASRPAPPASSRAPPKAPPKKSGGLFGFGKK